MKTALKTRSGESKPVSYGDPLFDTLDGRRVRFGKVEADGMVEVLDDATGRALPDLRHPTQVVAY
jgi:hypothetical protein